MTSRRHRKSIDLASRAVELSFAVPQVIAHRMMRVALAGCSPSLRDRKEFHLMSAEKGAAFFESWNAMLFELYRANVALAVPWGPLVWLGWPSTRRASRAAAEHFQRTALAVVAKGVAPIHRRAVANAKRLGRAR